MQEVSNPLLSMSCLSLVTSSAGPGHVLYIKLGGLGMRLAVDGQLCSFGVQVWVA